MNRGLFINQSRNNNIGRKLELEPFTTACDHLALFFYTCSVSSLIHFIFGSFTLVCGQTLIIFEENLFHLLLVIAFVASSIMSWSACWLSYQLISALCFGRRSGERSLRSAPGAFHLKTVCQRHEFSTKMIACSRRPPLPNLPAFLRSLSRVRAFHHYLNAWDRLRKWRQAKHDFPKSIYHLISSFEEVLGGFDGKLRMIEMRFCDSIESPPCWPPFPNSRLGARAVSKTLFL